jgi:hypothetical protein
VKPIRNQPKPHNLREQVLQKISVMPESDVAQVYELLLLAEKSWLRAEISKQAGAENDRGACVDLPEFIAAYNGGKEVRMTVCLDTNVLTQARVGRDDSQQRRNVRLGETQSSPRAQRRTPLMHAI